VQRRLDVIGKIGLVQRVADDMFLQCLRIFYFACEGLSLFKKEFY